MDASRCQVRRRRAGRKQPGRLGPLPLDHGIRDPRTPPRIDGETATSDSFAVHLREPIAGLAKLLLKCRPGGRTMKAGMLGLMVAAMLMAPTISHSIPTTYFASSPLIGSGTFTIDVGLPLGDYFATNVSGGGGTQVSPWTGVEFRAELGTDPDLLFTGINPSTGTALFGFADYIGIP